MMAGDADISSENVTGWNGNILGADASRAEPVQSAEDATKYLGFLLNSNPDLIPSLQAAPSSQLGVPSVPAFPPNPPFVNPDENHGEETQSSRDGQAASNAENVQKLIDLLRILNGPASAGAALPLAQPEGQTEAGALQNNGMDSTDILNSNQFDWPAAVPQSSQDLSNSELDDLFGSINGLQNEFSNAFAAQQEDVVALEGLETELDMMLEHARNGAPSQSDLASGDVSPSQVLQTACNGAPNQIGNGAYFQQMPSTAAPSQLTLPTGNGAAIQQTPIAAAPSQLTLPIGNAAPSLLVLPTGNGIPVQPIDGSAAPGQHLLQNGNGVTVGPAEIAAPQQPSSGPMRSRSEEHARRNECPFHAHCGHTYTKKTNLYDHLCRDHLSEVNCRSFSFRCNYCDTYMVRKTDVQRHCQKCKHRAAAMCGKTVLDHEVIRPALHPREVLDEAHKHKLIPQPNRRR